MKRRASDAPGAVAARDAIGSQGSAALTITLPMQALSGLVVQAPPPALVSSEMGAEYVGLKQPELVEHLGWMARQPRWRALMIVVSQKRRFAAPGDVIASMR